MHVGSFVMQYSMYFRQLNQGGMRNSSFVVQKSSTSGGATSGSSNSLGHLHTHTLTPFLASNYYWYAKKTAKRFHLNDDYTCAYAAVLFSNMENVIGTFP